MNLHQARKERSGNLKSEDLVGMSIMVCENWKLCSFRINASGKRKWQKK